MVKTNFGISISFFIIKVCLIKILARIRERNDCALFGNN